MGGGEVGVQKGGSRASDNVAIEIGNDQVGSVPGKSDLLSDRPSVMVAPISLLIPGSGGQ